jgi:hypothetical protein
MNDQDVRRCDKCGRVLGFCTCPGIAATAPQASTPMPDKLPSAETLALAFYGGMALPMKSARLLETALNSAFAAIRADEARIQSERYAACVEALKECVEELECHRGNPYCSLDVDPDDILKARNVLAQGGRDAEKDRRKKIRGDGVLTAFEQGIAQGRQEAADDYCKECCCFSVCSEDANEKLYCQIRQNILGTASSEKIKES